MDMDVQLCPNCFSQLGRNPRHCDACGSDFLNPRSFKIEQLVKLPKKSCPQCYRSVPTEAYACARCHAPTAGSVQALNPQTQAWLDSLGRYEDIHYIALNGACSMAEARRKLAALPITQDEPATDKLVLRVNFKGAPSGFSNGSHFHGYLVEVWAENGHMIVHSFGGSGGIPEFAALWAVARAFSADIQDQETGQRVLKIPEHFRDLYGIIVEEHAGFAWIRSCGLARSGRPDLEVLEVPEAEIAQATEWIHVLAATLKPGDFSPPYQDIGPIHWLPFEHLKTPIRGPGSHPEDRQKLPFGSFVIRAVGSVSPPLPVAAPETPPQPNSLSPWIPTVASLLFPGVGQMLLGQKLKGALLLFGGAGVGYLCGLINLYAAWDAYQQAQKPS